MTLSYEDKVQIYELRHIGKSIKCLSEKFSDKHLMDFPMCRSS
ncbi:hypothetical protein [Streptococcus equi]|nr:hypothetical protein [Streptococcus equi]